MICPQMFCIDYTSIVTCTFAQVTFVTSAGAIDKIHIVFLIKFLFMYQLNLSATPGIIPGLNYQIYCPCVQCKNLPSFLTLTVDCHPPSVDISLLGIRYLPTPNVFLILKQAVGFYVIQVCVKHLYRLI